MHHITYINDEDYRPLPGGDSMDIERKDKRIAELEAELDRLRDLARKKINAELNYWSANNENAAEAAEYANELAHDELADLLREGGRA